jgi:hypothetical protein
MSEGSCVSGSHLIAAAEKTVFSRDVFLSWACKDRGERYMPETKKPRKGSKESMDLDFIVVRKI